MRLGRSLGIVIVLTCFLALPSQIQLAVCQQTSVVIGTSPKDVDKLREKQRETVCNLLRGAGVPFDPDELFSPMWKIRLKDTLDHMPEMRQVRYEKKALAGVYIADTMYLGEHVSLSGSAVILANHLLFEGARPTFPWNYGSVTLNIFTRFPNETLGKSLKDILHEAGIPEPPPGQTPPSFDELTRALNLDPYRHGPRYTRVFEPVAVRIEANGKPGAPGENGADGQQGGRTERYKGKMGDGAKAEFPKPTGDIPPEPPPF